MTNFQSSIIVLEALQGVPGIRYGVTTRQSGSSLAPYASLNLGYHVDDQASSVAANRRLMCESADIELASLIVPQQTHSAKSCVVGVEDCGRGAYDHKSTIPNVDALITRDMGITLMVLVADCSPILIYDPVRRAIAAIHAGRKGTTNGIVSHVINRMISDLGCAAQNILVAIGPSISGERYLITEAAASEASETAKKAVWRDGNGSPHFDLAAAHHESLQRLGVPSANISVSNQCTFSCDDLFFSERRDGPPTGRFGAFISLT